MTIRDDKLIEDLEVLLPMVLLRGQLAVPWLSLLMMTVSVALKNYLIILLGGGRQ